MAPIIRAGCGAEKGERVEGRLSYRSGYYPPGLVTRLGKLTPIARAVVDRDLRTLPAQRESVDVGFESQTINPILKP